MTKNNKLVNFKSCKKIFYFRTQIVPRRNAVKKINFRYKLSCNTAYFILGCGFIVALLSLGHHLYSPWRAPRLNKLTLDPRWCHIQEQNQRTIHMFAAIIKHRLTFWSYTHTHTHKKDFPSSFPFLVCLAPSVTRNFEPHHGNHETGRSYQYAWDRTMVFPLGRWCQLVKT
jgi:hypothetical protein